MKIWNLLISLSVTPFAAGQILVNGSFEADVGGATVNLAGPFTLAGWSGVGPSSGGNAGLVVGPDNGLSPADGSQHFTFNGGNPSDRGWIEQSFATTPGATYTLSFALGRSGGSQDLSVRADVSSGGVSYATASFIPGNNAGYTSITMSFVAPDALSTLRFTDTSGPNSVSDLYLDRVAVSAVPEANAAALWLGGCALGVAAYECRRRAQDCRAG